ncbi:hypothetical protein P691DRAFT_776210 [Macrolepiota fuliginosa MF-IS2]|uniref:G domain-containing protein n=1 Tax=Macrolepiota fuliginosa MF-IS2 TaxID=1400762 RepID=A0A9P5XC62_9AGAR|nr:hypothetical protein P691DRAFT_776210 [Macrolepiota fuliginosa MF-IS2]
MAEIEIADIQDDDVVIVFMGPTGAGKSYFIDLLTNQQAKRAGDTLMSVTKKVQATCIQHPDNHSRIVLVDTPGFGDTTGGDALVLKLVSKWLQRTYKRGIKLSGIAYLHCITAKRMRGSTCKSLHVFGKICGDIAANQVLLVSTMWQSTKSEDGAKKEEQLKAEYWKPLIDAGARVDRLTLNNTSEAWRVIDNLIKQSGERKVLLLQEELVELEKRLKETQAGMALYATLQKSLNEQKKVLDFLRRQLEQSENPLLVKELREECDKIEQGLQNIYQEAEKLRIPIVRRVITFIFGKKARAKPIM